MLLFAWFAVVAAVLAYRVERRPIDPSAPLAWWQTRVDRYAARWPRPIYWSYVVTKWYLVAAGGFGVTMHYLHRMGLPSLIH